MMCIVYMLLLQAHHTHCNAIQRDLLVLDVRLACLVSGTWRLAPSRNRASALRRQNRQMSHEAQEDPSVLRVVG